MTNEINYIKRVEISGLWDRFDIEWDLNPDVNIIAGINGIGKTTILDCIYALVSIGRIPDPYLGILKKINLFFDNGKPISYEYIKIIDTIKNIEKKAKNGDIISQEFMSELKEREGQDYKKIHSVTSERHKTSFEDLQMTVDEINKIINIDVISTFDTNLKQSEAIKKLSDDQVKTELDWEIYQLQKKYLDYQLTLSKRKDIILSIKNEYEMREQFTKLQYPQKRFLELIDDLFSETGKKVNKDENQIEFLLADKAIKVYQLSSGEKQLLIILLTVLIQDNKPSILFMDEPEISLHIQWQKKIIQYIRELNPNVQVIIATHSPAIIMDGWMDKVFNMSDIIINK